MSDVDLAWLAGLIEGEGSFTLSGRNKNLVRCSVQMTDHDVLAKAKRITGVGNIFSCGKQKEHHRNSWVWSVQVDARARELMKLLRPLMGQRRRRRIEELIGA